MTAPEPTTEHIDAVAFLLATSNGTVLDYVPGGADDADPYIRDARAILTTPRADIHSALAASLPAEVMLAALVDRGALEPHDWRVVGASGIVYSTVTEAGSRAVANQPGDVIQCRHATGWREVAP